MRKNIILAMALVFSMIIMAGCGGGGGSAPTACTDTEWLPAVPETAVVGDRITQTSNCGNSREYLVGQDWYTRAGESVATLFKSFTGIMQDIKAVPDYAGNSLVYGRDSASVGNKALLARVAPDGTHAFILRTDSPVGNTITNYLLKTDGIRIATLYERSVLHDMNAYAVDMQGNGIISEINLGYGLKAADVDFGSSDLYLTRLQPDVPLPDPFPFSATQLIRGSLVTSDTPINVTPLLDPRLMLADSIGVFLFGEGSYMRYDRDLNVVIPVTQWATGTSRVIHDVERTVNGIVIAGVADGIFTVSMIGNPAFRNSSRIPVGENELVQLCQDSQGNVYVSIGNRFGRLNMQTGEMTTLNPPAVPLNAPWYISGPNAYFVVSSTDIHVMPLSMVH